MRFQILAVAAACLGFAAAQSSAALPSGAGVRVDTFENALTCSGSAVVRSVGTFGCEITLRRAQCTLSTIGSSPCMTVTNTTCVCTNTQFQAAVYQCYVNSCSQADTQAAEAYGAQLCASLGTPINTSVAPSGITTPATRSSAAATGTALSSSVSRAVSSISASISASISSTVASSASASASSARTGSATKLGPIGVTALVGVALAGTIALFAGAIVV